MFDTYPFWFPSSCLGTHFQAKLLLCSAAPYPEGKPAFAKQSLAPKVRSQAGAWERENKRSFQRNWWEAPILDFFVMLRKAKHLVFRDSSGTIGSLRMTILKSQPPPRGDEEGTPVFDNLEGLNRTHSCGELRLADAGREVVLMGWVQRRRDHGGLIFVDLRDRRGLTQVVFNPEVNPDTHTKAGVLRDEFVLAVRGVVNPRPPEMVNP